MTGFMRRIDVKFLTSTALCLTLALTPGIVLAEGAADPSEQPVRGFAMPAAGALSGSNSASGNSAAPSAGNTSLRSSAVPGLRRPETIASLPPFPSSSRQTGVQETILANGLRVLVLEQREFPVVSTFMWYRTGSRSESSGTTGLSHLVEHLLFQNVGSFKEGEIGSSIARSGGQFNGYTSDDFITFFETLPPARVELALKIESERMRQGKFDEKAISREIENIQKEFENEERDPIAMVSQEVRALLFMQHPYHNPVLGWRSDLENLNVRQVKDFYDRYFQPGNATLVICGDVNSKLCAPLIQKYFGSIPAGPALNERNPLESPCRSERRVSVRYPGKQEILQVGWHAPALDSGDAAAMVILEKLLNGGLNGRLKTRLVDAKLCSAANASYEIKKEPGFFTITTSAIPATLNAQQKMLDGLDAVVAPLRDKPITDSELKRARNLATYAFHSECDGPYRAGFHLGYFDSLDNWQSNYTWADRLRAVNANDVMRVARKYLGQEGRVIGFVQGAAAPKPVTPAPAKSGSEGSKDHEKPFPTKLEHVRMSGYKTDDSAQTPESGNHKKSSTADSKRKDEKHSSASQSLTKKVDQNSDHHDQKSEGKSEKKNKLDQKTERKADANLQHKSDSKSDSKLILKGEHRSDQKSEQKTEHKTDQKADLKAQHNSDQKSDQKAEHRTDQKADLKAQHNSDQKSDQKAEHRTDQKADLKAQHNSDQKPDQKAEHRTDQKADLKAEHNSDQRAEQKSDQKTDQKADLKAEQKPEKITDHKSEQKSDQNLSSKDSSPKDAGTKTITQTRPSVRSIPRLIEDIPEALGKAVTGNIPGAVGNVGSAIRNVPGAIGEIGVAVGHTASAIGKQIAQLGPRPEPVNGRVSKRVLRNGVNLLVFESHVSPIVHITGSIEAGDVYNPSDKPGLSAVTAAVLNQGGTKHSRTQMLSIQDDLGISPPHMLHFENKMETIDFQASCLSRDLSTQLDLIAESVSNPLLDDATLDRSRQEALAGQKKYEDTMSQKVDRVLMQCLLAEKSPYCPADPSDKIKSIGAVGAPELQKFFSSHIAPGGTTIVVSGDIQPDQAASMLERAFSTWNGRQTHQRLHAKESAKRVLRTAIPSKDSKKSTLCFGQLIPIAPSHADYGSLLIADGILVNHPMVSRFEQQIARTPALEAALNNSEMQVGLDPVSNHAKWSLTISVEPGAVPVSVQTVKRELRNLSRNGVTAEEFAEVRRYLLGSIGVRDESTLSRVARNELDLAQHGGTVDGYAVLMASLKGATVDSVNRVIRTGFKPEQSTLVVAGSGQSIRAVRNNSTESGAPAGATNGGGGSTPGSAPGPAEDSE